MTTEEAFPELARWAKQREEDLDTGIIKQTTIDFLKARTSEDGETGGAKWKALAERTMREHALQGIPA